jgi:hypothetical protein
VTESAEKSVTKAIRPAAENNRYSDAQSALRIPGIALLNIEDRTRTFDRAGRRLGVGFGRAGRLYKKAKFQLR